MENQNNPEPVDPDAVARQRRWQQEQLRSAERAVRGMTSRDFGTGFGGEFIEPVRLADPVMPLYPEETQLLESAVTMAIVSGNQSIATPIIPTASNEQPELQNVGVSDFSLPPASEPPKSTASDITIEDRAPFTSSLPNFGLGEDGPIFTSQAPSSHSGTEPGQPPRPPRLLELPETGGEQKPASGQGQPQEGGSKAPGASGEQKTGDPPSRFTRQATRDGRPTPEQVSAARRQQREFRQRESVQPGGQGVGPVAMGDAGMMPDYGSAGATAYRDPTASQLGVLREAEEATDAIDNTMELFVELLRRLTAGMIRSSERLDSLLDGLDAEDDWDEF